jgi:hypothetical protein
MDLLWKEVMKNTTPLEYFNTIKVAAILKQNNSPTFQEKGDVLPIGRDKLIHTQGVIARFNSKLFQISTLEYLILDAAMHC